MTKTAAQKDNHDAELQEIALREFGKGYSDLDEHEKHQCAGYKGSSHRTAAHAVAEGTEKVGTFAVTYVPAGSPHPPDPELEKYARETFNKTYDELDSHQKRVVGGKKGSSHAHGVKPPHLQS